MKTITNRFFTLASGLLLAAGAGSALAQRDYSNVEVVPHHVAGNYYYLEGAGGNIGVSIGDDGVIMIDDQFAPLTDKILAAIRSLDDGPIRFVINTHVHPDHVGGNENLGRMGLLILARDEVRVRLESQLPEVALPVMTYSESITIHLNDDEVTTIPVPPAHTDGDSYIYFRNADVIHAGDVFRTVAFPVIDQGNGGTLDGTIDGLALLIGMAGPNTMIVPGHGVPSSREDVMEFRDMVLDVKARVQALVAQGMSFEQVMAARPTAQYEAKWGDPERFLTAVYSELSGN
ncbi:MAG: MBL fold metallo-hydrolase [Gammaproteobacteria bacterium]|nr:MBL fold metallo-hydrolase [Pseudomonadales bacterium]MCP5345716.1 MBL fold metallo-hydrolase [Pseudomonadales bacterium]